MKKSETLYNLFLESKALYELLKIQSEAHGSAPIEVYKFIEAYDDVLEAE